MAENNFIKQLQQITGSNHVLTKPTAMAPYCHGFRFGQGKAAAVVLPQSLLQLWQVTQLCVQQDKIIIMQAANTGLTGGSTPAGDDYDREVIVISVNAIKGVHTLNAGTEVLAFPGSSLTELELALAPFKREPHSVIGSSCIGASVIGGICNNSGGSLIRRGPAYTEMALFARVNAQGELELINNLGIELGASPEEILQRLQQKDYQVAADSAVGKKTWADDYATKIRDVEADTPARYNGDPSYWHQASGCSGKLVVFAVRLSSFAAAQQPKVFYIGANSEQPLISLRKALLTRLEQLPIAAEYMDRSCFDVTYRYAKSIHVALSCFGPSAVPTINKIKQKLDRFISKLPWLSINSLDKFIDWLGAITPAHLPPRLLQYRDKYQHYLMLKIDDHQVDAVQALLSETLTAADAQFFLCNNKEAKAAFLHRFAAGGAPGIYIGIKNKPDSLLSLDISLRRNDQQWLLQLPPQLQQQIELAACCGHFCCYVVHQYYILKAGVDKKEFKRQVLAYLDGRGAQYPAEHNVGHLYHANAAHLDFFRELDPTNSLNPGVGISSKQKNWQS